MATKEKLITLPEDIARSAATTLTERWIIAHEGEICQVHNSARRKLEEEVAAELIASYGSHKATAHLVPKPHYWVDSAEALEVTDNTILDSGYVEFVNDGGEDES
jgi:hypothetical protein